MTENILVTGASRGVGAAIVRELTKNSEIKTIIAVSRESAHFNNLINELENIHKKVRIIPIFYDLNDHENIGNIFDFIEEEDLSVDTLINNAGYTCPQSINEISHEEFLKTLHVNLLSPFFLVQNFIKRQVRPELIINIASTAGINGRPGWLTYSASKAAMINMSDIMREELKPYGTKVVCLSPGRCATDLRKKLAPDEDPSVIMQPEQLAQIVNLMCSKIGRLIDSQNLVVRR